MPSLLIIHGVLLLLPTNLSRRLHISVIRSCSLQFHGTMYSIKLRIQSWAELYWDSCKGQKGVKFMWFVNTMAGKKKMHFCSSSPDILQHINKYKSQKKYKTVLTNRKIFMHFPHNSFIL